MADPNQLREQVMAALQLAKPISRDQGFAIAQGVLESADALAWQQFQKWYAANGDTVVAMINV